MTCSRSYIKLGNVLGTQIQLFLIPGPGISHSSMFIFKSRLESLLYRKYDLTVGTNRLYFYDPRMDGIWSKIEPFSGDHISL